MSFPITSFIRNIEMESNFKDIQKFSYKNIFYSTIFFHFSHHTHIVHESLTSILQKWGQQHHVLIIMLTSDVIYHVVGQNMNFHYHPYMPLVLVGFKMWFSLSKSRTINHAHHFAEEKEHVLVSAHILVRYVLQFLMLIGVPSFWGCLFGRKSRKRS